MAKKKGGSVGTFGVNSVSVAACISGNAPVNANVTFPTGAEEKKVFASIVRAANPSVDFSGPVQMQETSPGNYIIPTPPGGLSAPSASGPYKAKVFSTYKLPTTDGPVFSNNFPGCAPSSLKGAAGPDDCCR